MLNNQLNFIIKNLFYILVEHIHPVKFNQYNQLYLLLQFHEINHCLNLYT